MSKYLDAKVTSTLPGCLVEYLHYGPYSQFWWNFKAESSNNKESFFPIHIGQTTCIYLNDCKFVMHVVIGNSEDRLNPGWCCISDNESVTEVSSKKAISSVYQKLFGTTTRYSGSMVIGLDNQSGFLNTTPAYIRNNSQIFWLCFNRALEDNKKNYDEKQRMLSIIADQFTYTELEQKLRVGRHTISEARKYGRINGYRATPLQKPEISHVKLTPKMVVQFDEFFFDKANVNPSSYKTEPSSGLPVLYLHDTKKSLEKVF
ncbi:hypothetical protein C2G38_2213512 [Gigaspora rosea]|uniref:Uncharacterized protein n=1 Tax=Gigaspora rosea TaxID=44941 RepID=A0A397UBU2_9GLOM|nr:hypothetical protein C2G38_2213512 [Gigaspora rosea]